MEIGAPPPPTTKTRKSYAECGADTRCNERSLQNFVQTSVDRVKHHDPGADPRQLASLPILIANVMTADAMTADATTTSTRPGGGGVVLTHRTWGRGRPKSLPRTRQMVL